MDALIGVVAFSFVGLLLQLAIISVAVRRLNAYIYQHQYEEAGGSSPLTPTIFAQLHRPITDCHRDCGRVFPVKLIGEDI